MVVVVVMVVLPWWWWWWLESVVYNSVSDSALKSSFMVLN